VKQYKENLEKAKIDLAKAEADLEHADGDLEKAEIAQAAATDRLSALDTNDPPYDREADLERQRVAEREAEKGQTYLKDESGKVVQDVNGKPVRVVKSASGKTEHVSGYTTKSGKHVAPYMRRPGR